MKKKITQMTISRKRIPMPNRLACLQKDAKSYNILYRNFIQFLRKLYNKND